MSSKSEIFFIFYCTVLQLFCNLIIYNLVFLFLLFFCCCRFPPKFGSHRGPIVLILYYIPMTHDLYMSVTCGKADLIFFFSPEIHAVPLRYGWMTTNGFILEQSLQLDMRFLESMLLYKVLFLIVIEILSVNNS